jgi:hypothetical protein
MASQPAGGRVEVYARALLEIVAAEEHLDEVEDELFRFARIVEGNDDLRMSLANPGLPLERRAAIVDELLETRALTVTKAVASFIVGPRSSIGSSHSLRRVASTRWPKCARPSRSTTRRSSGSPRPSHARRARTSR